MYTDDRAKLYSKNFLTIQMLFYFVPEFLCSLRDVCMHNSHMGGVPICLLFCEGN